jgi:predicted transcriptional regulator
MGNEDVGSVNSQVVLDRLSRLHEDVSDLRESTKDSMKEIANAISKLVVIDERQSQTTEAFNRVLGQLDRIDARVQALEKDEAIKKLVSKWVLAGVWTAAGTSVLFAAKYVGLIT